MTIANVILSERSAVLFSDTAWCDENAVPVGRVSKLRIVPHLGCAFILRGPTDIARALHEALAAGRDGGDLDDAIDRLPEILRTAVDDCRADFPDKPASLFSCELFLAGFSPRRGRARFVTCASNSDFAVVDRMPGCYINPPPAEHVRLPSTMTLAQAVQVANVQRDMMQASAERLADGSGAGIGGELLAVEIAENGLRVREVHRWAEDAESSVA